MRREGLALGLVLLLGCGGKGEQTSFLVTPGGAGGAGSGAAPSDGGDQAVAGSDSLGGEPTGGTSPEGGASAGQGGKPTAGGPGGGAGGSAAGTSGGSAGNGAAGDTSSAGAGGEGGATEPPDDTGCVERPWSGNQADLSEKLPGLDCSKCSNGATLGYTVPAFCAAPPAVCFDAQSVTDLPANDVFMLLPHGSPASGYCKEQNCEGRDGEADNLPGFTLQMTLQLPSGHSVRVQTDEHRRVLKRDVPLFECSEASTCVAFGSSAQLAIVARPDAPRGWVRVTVDKGAVCE